MVEYEHFLFPEGKGHHRVRNKRPASNKYLNKLKLSKNKHLCNFSLHQIAVSQVSEHNRSRRVAEIRDGKEQIASIPSPQEVCSPW